VKTWEVRQIRGGQWGLYRDGEWYVCYAGLDTSPPMVWHRRCLAVRYAQWLNGEILRAADVERW
jgi:hypothetical protein